MILGPLAENQFRRALSISQNDASVFLTHQLSASLLALALAVVAWPWLRRRVARR